MKRNQILLPHMLVKERAKSKTGGNVRRRVQRLHKSFDHFVGQQDAIVQLKSFANTYFAEGRPFNALLVGPRSAGKTSMSKALADAMEINFIDADANVLTNADSIAAQMMEALVRMGVDVPFDEKANTFRMPPLLYFIDEFQELSGPAQGGLLRATERSDARMMTRSGRIFDCTNVIWVGATTNPEQVVDTLVSRFRAVECRSYTMAEVVEMLINVYPKWPLDVCARIIYYAGTFPRIAKAFAERVYDLAKLEGTSLAATVERIARMNHIDEWGMHEKTLRILRLLQAHPEGMIQREIAQQLGVDGKAVVKTYMPPLMRVGSHAALVVHDDRYYITSEGVEYLQNPWPVNID